MERNVTIKDVADRAKVGIATVSRVLNNSDRVDPETRQRVREAIRRLGYRPNATGRRLVKKSSEMVCFLLSNRDFVNPFHSGVLFGVERYLSGAGHDVVFTTLNYDADAKPEDIPLPRIITHRGIADGFIVAGTNSPNLLAAMDELQVPYVFFGNNLVGAANERRPDAVYYDDRESGRRMIDRIIGMGHRHIWFAGDNEMPWFQRRGEIYRQAMTARGLLVREFSVSGADQRDYAVYGETAMARILESGEPVTAVVGGNDGIAYGAWRALSRMGLRVPGDITVVGFDDVIEARLCDPQLTTVRVPTDAVGEACAAMLLEKLKAHGAPRKPVVLQAQLVERQSWGPPPGEQSRRKE